MALVIMFVSCEPKSKTLNFSGLKKNINLYRTSFKIEQSKNFNVDSSDDQRFLSEIDWKINLIDSITCNVEIVRVMYLIKNHSMFYYYFDTGKDSVKVESDYLSIEFNEKEKQKVQEALNTLKKIKGKSFMVVKNESGFEFKSKTFSLEDFRLDSRYNPAEYLTKFLHPEEFFPFFENSFFPEIGSFENGKNYVVKHGSDSTYYSYCFSEELDEIEYLKNKIEGNKIEKITSVIDFNTRELSEGVFSSSLKVKETNTFPPTIIYKEKEIRIEKLEKTESS